MGTKKDKEKKQCQNIQDEYKEKVEIIINFLNEPSEQAIKNLNKAYQKIIADMIKDGRIV